MRKRKPKPGVIEVYGPNKYVYGLADAIDKSWWSGVQECLGFTAFFRCKAKHHIRRLRKYIELPSDDVIRAEGFVFVIPRRWDGPCVKDCGHFGYGPENWEQTTEWLHSMDCSWAAALGVSRDCTYEEARSGFRGRAKRAHPDGGGSTEAMADLLEAWRQAKIYFRKG